MATKTEQGQKQGLWGKIQDWYAQPGIQMAVGMVYSIGAAVVIVGALFKIMHWPGAGVMLTAGMMTEAILFTTDASAYLSRSQSSACPKRVFAKTFLSPRS